MNRIPRHFHFIFGLKEQKEPFHLAFYLALESCLQVNRPEALSFHYHYEPFGEYWERIRDRLILEKVNLEEFILENPRYEESDEGMFIRLNDLDYAHQSDFIRLKVLGEKGGVYADIDTLFVNPLPDELFDEEFILGREDDNPERSDTLGNALILSRPESEFAGRWLDYGYRVFDGSWNRHSCRAAAELAAENPRALRILPARAFYHFAHSPPGLRALFEERHQDLAGVFSIHLWAHLWWDPWRRDFSSFHADLLTEDYVLGGETTYAAVARRFL